MSKKKDEHYVDNVQLYQAMVERTEEVNKILIENGLSIGSNRAKSLQIARKSKKIKFPQISEYIGTCVLKICQRLLFHPSFSGYSDSWKEDMLGDGLENVLRYIDNFNPEKTKNPFAYFTQIVWYAYVRRIESEKTQQYTKMKAIQMSGLFDDNVTQDVDDKVYKNGFVKFVQQNMGDIITQFEAKKEKKQATKKKPVKVKKQNSLEKLVAV